MCAPCDKNLIEKFCTDTLLKDMKMMYKISGITCDKVAWVAVWTYSHTSCLYQNVTPTFLESIRFTVYRTITLPVVLYGCETWSLTLREELKLRVFENMVLRRIFGPRRDEVTGGMEEIA